MLYGVIFMDMFFGILFTLFMFIGVVASAYAVLFFLLRPKRKNEVLLIPIDENSGDIRTFLGFAGLKLSVSGEGLRIVFVDMGLNNVQLQLCEEFCGEYPLASVIKPEKITEVL